jgi:bacterial/archaeal transporter family protein
MRWFVPTLGFVALMGVLGIWSRYALKQVSWQGLIVVTALGYAAVILVMFLLRQPLGAQNRGANRSLDWTITALGAAIPALALVCLYIALGRGDASKVIPVGSVYPLVTVVLAAIFLGEALTWKVAIGAVLVVAGVIAISL